MLEVKPMSHYLHKHFPRYPPTQVQIEAMRVQQQIQQALRNPGQPSPVGAWVLTRLN